MSGLVGGGRGAPRRGLHTKPDDESRDGFAAGQAVMYTGPLHLGETGRRGTVRGWYEDGGWEWVVVVWDDTGEESPPIAPRALEQVEP